MKKIMFAFAAMLGSVAFVSAQEGSDNIKTPETVQPETVQPGAVQQDEKVKIKSEELPDAVKKALETQDYRGWLIDAAYKYTSTATATAAATETFEVHLKNGAEAKVVKFDMDGKKVE